MFKYAPAIRGWKQAVLAGYFGPIGVSAVFYLTVLLDYTRGLNGDEDSTVRLRETARLVVWFIMVSSAIVHGITVPIFMVCPAKISYYIYTLKRGEKANSSVFTFSNSLALILN